MLLEIATLNSNSNKTIIRMTKIPNTNNPKENVHVA
jgi:hypothetical protein